MGLNDTPVAERIHIGFFGRRNAGKSSVVNAIAGQEVAVVSEKKGTTTDPVSKTMELLPLGPVVIIDTPGYDDDEEVLGEKRILRTKRILNRSDIAVLVTDSADTSDRYDSELIGIFREKKIPYIIVYNKCDLSPAVAKADNEIAVSALTGDGINALKELLGALAPAQSERRIAGNLIEKNDVVILVTPIDESAPKGRMILPQVQTIRDILDSDAICVTVKETELEKALSSLAVKPKLVITDSQAFSYVSGIVPDDIELTSFSILMAKYKGFLDSAVRGAAFLKNLRDGDTVLIAEGCTHHRQCNDIGTVKIPALLKKYTGSQINIKTCSGNEFPEDLSPYAAVIHCGACMLSEREMLYRMKCAEDRNVPFTNYGITIALANGILRRSLGVFPELQKIVTE
jgi:[FeFe] hydrogenase H-cluster maturation GTPase HydF